MKILQVSNKPPYPPHDGGSMAMFNLARSLGRNGNTITMLTIFTEKHKLTEDAMPAFNGFAGLHTVFVDTTTNFAKMLQNLIFSRKPYNAERFISKAFENELVRLLRTEKYDVIQLEGLYLCPYINTIRNNSKALISLRAHNVEHEVWNRVASTEKSHLRKLYFRLLADRIQRLEYESMNLYDVLVPITTRDLAQFNGMGNVRPAIVCPAGIDMPEYPSDIENEGQGTKSSTSVNFTLYFLGSLDWIPNQEGLSWFIETVFPRLRQNFPKLKLCVAGRNAPGYLVKRISMPGVEFYGEIADSREFIEANSALVAPCFSGGGMRVKIIEAMAFGKPVITTVIGAEGLAAEHDKNILIADNSPEFAEQVERLMKFPDLCLRIGQNARRLVNEKFNNMAIANSLSGFYKANLK